MSPFFKTPYNRIGLSLLDFCENGEQPDGATYFDAIMTRALVACAAVDGSPRGRVLQVPRGDYRVGVSPLWRLGKKTLGVYLPLRFRRGRPFHAGTAQDSDGTLRAAGGRVLNVTARAPTLAEARDRAYAAVDAIDWPGGFHRRDIGWRALPAVGSGR